MAAASHFPYNPRELLNRHLPPYDLDCLALSPSVGASLDMSVQTNTQTNAQSSSSSSSKTFEQEYQQLFPVAHERKTPRQRQRQQQKNDTTSAAAAKAHKPGRKLVGQSRNAGSYLEEEDGHYDGQQTQPQTPSAAEDVSKKEQLWREYVERLRGDERKEVQQLLAQGQGRDAIWNIRQLKELTPDYKLLDKERHGSHRFVLPLSESDLKQPFLKKSKDHDDNKSDDNKNDDNKNDDNKNGHNDDKDKDETKSNADDTAESDRNDSQDEQLRAIMDEMHHLSSLSNHVSGRSLPPIPSSERDADQLEFCISQDDQFTPDNWIPRSQKLLRLTGKHPMNAEPHLSELYDAGMITLAKLHYVRNHGSVPQLDWDTHRVEVSSKPDGLAGVRATSFSMDEIAAMEWVELPITIACTGNRRQEVNLVRKSAGFGWSAGGVSNARWKGAFVRDLLIRAGVASHTSNDSVFEQPQRLWVHFEGADELTEGSYGTSLPFSYVMDACNDVLLAYESAGRVLSPDHGYPVRLIIPGQVGGRCIKWVSRIWIEARESTNYYHIWDNRFLPSFLDTKQSPLARALFHHPSTAIFEQTLQSVIVYPAHNETFSLPPAGGEATYDLRGFAYNGGGRMVDRVELSLDGGATWRYCYRKFCEMPLRHGSKCWSWVYWHCRVTVEELLQAEELAVRAFDTQKNTQPRELVWNLLGMMNNSWYRVRRRLSLDDNTKAPKLTFVHPVGPGATTDGWMQPDPAQAAQNEAASDGEGKQITLDEFKQHASEKDAWIVIGNKVYDVTSVLGWHPGGAHSIISYAGVPTSEVTTQYASIHDSYADSKRDECLVGTLDAAGIEEMQQSERLEAQKRRDEIARRRTFCLKRYKWTPAVLSNRREVSHDTRLYTFALKDESGSVGSHLRLGLPIGMHVRVGLHMADSMVVRSYTPTRPVLPAEEDGTFDLLVKTYFPSPPSSESGSGGFPPGGTLSNFLDTLQLGEEVDINGPTGEIEYRGHGKFSIEGEEMHFERVSLIGGGSGITPHWQLIHAILNTPGDETQVRLVDANKTKNDVLLYDRLVEYSQKYSDRFKAWFILSHPPPAEEEEWKYGTGHLDRTSIEQHIFPPDPPSQQNEKKEERGRSAVFLCGPPGMIEKGAMPALEHMGYRMGVNCFGF